MLIVCLYQIFSTPPGWVLTRVCRHLWKLRLGKLTHSTPKQWYAWGEYQERLEIGRLEDLSTNLMLGEHCYLLVTTKKRTTNILETKFKFYDFKSCVRRNRLQGNRNIGVHILEWKGKSQGEHWFYLIPERTYIKKKTDMREQHYWAHSFNSLQGIIRFYASWRCLVFRSLLRLPECRYILIRSNEGFLRDPICICASL